MKRCQDRAGGMTSNFIALMTGVREPAPGLKGIT